ncbi:MAG: metallophosphoesterase, partial [Acidobacteriota bacterium]
MSQTSNIITLLHLSDLHAQADTAWDSERVTNDLVADLQRLANDRELRPDLVLFTGDLAQAGTAADFEHGWGVIRAIQQAYTPSLTNKQIFLVPGNHDVDRNKFGELETAWRETAKEATVERLIQKGGRAWDQLTERLDDYRAFLKAHDLTHLQPDAVCANRAIWHATRSIAGASIGLVGFNTAWCSGENAEQGRLWMGAHWQHETLHQKVREADVRIAMLHHPPAWLHPHEAPKFARALRRDFHLILHGHEHLDWVDEHAGGRATIAAGACYQGSRRPNGYSVIRLDPGKHHVDVHLRRYDDVAGRWMPRPAPQETEIAERGIWRFAAPWLDRDASAAAAPPDAPAEVPLPPAKALRDKHADQLKTFLDHQRSQNDELPMAGFPSKVRMPIELDAIYVPLRAWLHERGPMHQRDEKGAARALDDELTAVDDDGRDVAFADTFRVAHAQQRRGAVVLGDPGSGKTTLLKHFLLTEPSVFGLPDDVKPVLVLLRGLPASVKGLPAALAHTLRATCADLDDADVEPLARALLRRGRLLLLFDGFDEVADAADREAIAAWLEKAIHLRKNCLFVMTSRYAGYRGDARLSSRFVELHVRPLAEEDATSFIDRWYRAVVDGFGREPDGRRATRADGARRAQALAERVFDEADARNKGLRELATNPLMLQILCLLFWDQGHLPEKRAELYEACVRTLLHLWRDAKKLRPADGQPAIGHTDALAVLQPLAWHLHMHDARELPEADVIDVIRDPLRSRRDLNLRPSDFLAQVRDQTGALVSLGRGDYGFLHLSFQEYLAACHVQDRFAKDRGVIDALAAHFGTDWWREVVLLSLGLTNPSVFDEVMRALIDARALSRDALLVSDCLRDAAEPSAAALLQALAEGVADDGERFQVLRLLKADALDGWAEATIADGRTGRAVLEGLRESESDGKARGLLRELLGIGAPAIVSALGEPEAGSERTHEQDGSVLVYVPGGSYTLGGDHKYEGRTIHTVQLSPYWIGKYPVTNA